MSFRTALLLSLVAAAVATSPVLAASAAPVDPPNCLVSGNGSPGTYSFTYHLTSDPCALPSRSYSECKIGSYVESTAYGPTISSPGSSKAQCGDQTVGHYGHEEYVAGSWQIYQMG